MIDLEKMAKEIRQIAKEHKWESFHEEWWDDETKKDVLPRVLCLMHSEISEAVEDYRINDKEHFFEEMADLFIRLLDCVGGFKRDFEKDILRKIEINRNRPIKHGNKKI